MQVQHRRSKFVRQGYCSKCQKYTAKDHLTHNRCNTCGTRVRLSPREKISCTNSPELARRQRSPFESEYSRHSKQFIVNWYTNYQLNGEEVFQRMLKSGAIVSIGPVTKNGPDLFVQGHSFYPWILSLVEEVI